MSSAGEMVSPDINGTLLSNWRLLGHVDPPDDERHLIFYLGPNHYAAGIYLPKGYDIEFRPGDEEDWTILRARDSVSAQTLTVWAVCDKEELGLPPKILDA